LIREGLVEGGLADTEIEEIRGEAHAIDHAVTLVGDDDLLVVFAEKVPSALATVRAHARTTS